MGSWPSPSCPASDVQRRLFKAQQVAALDRHAMAPDVEEPAPPVFSRMPRMVTVSCNCFWLAFSLRSTVKPAFSALANASVLALMYLDIDEFKKINDRYGHNAGDALLRGFAGRLSQTLRSTDTVAHLGGDEFSVIMEGLPRPNVASAVAAKIIQTMSTPSVIDRQTIQITTSIELVFSSGRLHDSRGARQTGGHVALPGQRRGPQRRPGGALTYGRGASLAWLN